MALLRCDFYSEALALHTSMTVLLPEPHTTADDPPPVLYLLHGLTDDHSAWTRYTCLERYAAERGLAVVMPAVHRSFYANEAYGMRFWDFLSTELPAIVQRFFRVSSRPADNFVAGLSMGGYGAFKWALRDPERFAAAASLSGALDLAYLQEHDDRPHIRTLLTNVYADRPLAGTEDDLLHLLRTADPPRLPRLLLRCGTEDHTLPQNEHFLDTCLEREVPIDAGFGPGGHTWDYWEAQLPGMLDFLLADRVAARGRTP